MNISLIDSLHQKGLILERIEKNDSLVKKTLVDLGGIIDGTFTFGTGITALLPAVKELVSGSMPELGEQDIILLYITAIWILTNKHKEKIQKLLTIIQEKGLNKGLSMVVDFLKSVENIALKIGESIGYTTNSLVDIVSFTFLAFPILDGLLFLMDKGLINPGSPTGYLKSVLFGVGLIGFKNIFNHIIKKLGGKLKSLDTTDQNLNEERNFYKETLIMVDDVMKLIHQTVNDPNVNTYYLPEDLRPDETIYPIDNFMFTVELTISRDEDIKDEFHLEAFYIEGEDTIEIGLIINPLMEPESYDHIENYLTEYIRHEIRHGEQEVMGTSPTNVNKDLDGLPYYTQDHEIDAQTSGLNARRRKQNRSFEEVIRNSVENTKKRQGLTDEEGEELYTILLKDITERYGRDSLHEAKGPKKNIPLDIGDEVLLISIDKNTFPAIPWRTTRPESTQLYLPYIVTAVIHRQPQNWEGPDDDTTVYKVTQKNLEDRALYSDTFIVSGKDDWIMNPGYRRGGWEEEQELRRLQEQKEPTKDIPKKVVLDNEDYRVYVPLKSSDICNIPNTEYCHSHNHWLTEKVYRGTPYIVEFKNKVLKPSHHASQFLIIDEGKIPLLMEPTSRRIGVNTNGSVEDLYEILSEEMELQKFFKLNYSLPQLIKFNMGFTEDSKLEGKEHSKLGELIYNININKADPEDLEEYYGEFDRYEDSYYISGGENEIELTSDGINVYLSKEDWLTNILEVGDGEYYYDLAHDLYYDEPYDELDEDELNYISCWFNDKQMKKLIPLMNTLKGTNMPLTKECHSFEEGEIADFFELYFPNEWDYYNGDLLYEVGKGIAKERANQMTEYFKNEIFLDYDHVGGDVRIHIGWEPLLYLVKTYLKKGETLDNLFTQPINSIPNELSDIFYDSYDWADGTEEEVEYVFDRLFEKIEDVDYEGRKEFIDKVRLFLHDEKFEEQGWGVHSFKKEQLLDDINKRTIGVRKIDAKDETITFDIESYKDGDSVKYGGERFTEPLEGFITKVKSPTLFDVY